MRKVYFCMFCMFPRVSVFSASASAVKIVRKWVTRGTCHFGKKYTLRFLENKLKLKVFLGEKYVVKAERQRGQKKIKVRF